MRITVHHALNRNGKDHTVHDGIFITESSGVLRIADREGSVHSAAYAPGHWDRVTTDAHTAQHQAKAAE